MRPLAITGLGVVSAAGVGYDRFREAVGAAEVDLFTNAPTTFAHAPHPALRVAEVPAFDPKAVVGDKGLRNNDRLTRLLLVASRLGLAHAGIKVDGAFTALDADAVGVCASTAYGSIEAISELDRVATLEDPRYLNPGKFPNTVINSAAGYVSIWDDLRALNVTVTNGPTGGLDVFDCAATYLGAGRAKAILVGGGEAMSEGLWQGLRRAGALATEDGGPGARLGEGAALLAVEPLDAAYARGARALARVTGYGTAFEPADEDAPMVAPSAEALARAIAAALRDAGVSPRDVSVVASGISGLAAVDAAEREGIAAALGHDVGVATLKSRFGETLGAAGALSAAAATAWLAGAPVRGLASGASPERVATVLVTAVGFYGNASALVLQREE